MPRSFWHLADDARRLPSPAPTRSSNNESSFRYWHFTDMTTVFGDVRLSGIKRAFGSAAARSASDPNRTSMDHQACRFERTSRFVISVGGLALGQDGRHRLEHAVASDECVK